VSASSPANFNQRPAVSRDGSKIVYACGPSESSAAPGTALCEASIDGKLLRQIAPSILDPAPPSEAYVASAAYAADGTLLVEGNLEAGSQIWRVSGDQAVRVESEDVISEGSPCVLPDGRVASVWAGRLPQASLHELKVTNADGTNPGVVLEGVDVSDIGIGCSK
jgi:hypothetical protein